MEENERRKKLETISTKETTAPMLADFTAIYDTCTLIDEF